MFRVFPVLFPALGAAGAYKGSASSIQILKLMGTHGTLGTSLSLNGLRCSHLFPELGTLGTEEEGEPIIENIQITDEINRSV